MRMFLLSSTICFSSPFAALIVLLFNLLLTSFSFAANSRKSFVDDSSDKLLLVQAVWRHGDRSPTTTFESDPNKEDKWPQGWGQLTPIGMGQHVTLGQKLREKYIDSLEMRNYKSAQIYVRSTDINRTLTSAQSNMIGFYGPGKAGEDYPDLKKNQTPWWPEGFIPIAVHTVEPHMDHLIPDLPDVPCPRQEILQQMIQKTPEHDKLMAEKKWLFDELSVLAGQNISLFNFWVLQDTLFIEDIYEKKLHLDMPSWTKNATLRAQITETSNLLDEWTNGKGLEPLNGVHFDVELPRIRGGPVLWILIDNMQVKLNCTDEQSRVLLSAQKSPTGSPLCDWISHKKYFAYSAHDTTIAALFAAFGFNKTNFDTDGFPHYSACVTVELWQNASDQHNHYIKAFYWPPDETDSKRQPEEITRNITGCEDGCSLAQFAARSQLYRPTPSADEYCKNTHFPSANSSKGFVTGGSIGSLLLLVISSLLLCLLYIHSI